MSIEKKTDVEEEEEFNLAYSVFCLITVSLIQISFLWAKTAFSAMYGYGVNGNYGDPYYSIQDDVPGFNGATYGSLVGFWYSILYCPSLLFLSPITEGWNRKFLIGLTCMTWGFLSFLNAYAHSMSTMYVLRLGIGLAQSMSCPPTYTLITDFFPPKYRVKAFFAFSIMQQIGDTMQYLTSNLIT